MIRIATKVFVHTFENDDSKNENDQNGNDAKNQLAEQTPGLRYIFPLFTFYPRIIFCLSSFFKSRNINDQIRKLF